MDDLTHVGPDLFSMIAAWSLAAVSWLCITPTSTRLQCALCATNMVLALSTIAEGVALPEVLLLMLWVVLATVLRWVGLDLERAVGGGRTAGGLGAADPGRPLRRGER